MTSDPDARWFLYDEVLIRDESGVGYWARSRDTAALDRVREALDGEWLY